MVVSVEGFIVLANGEECCTSTVIFSCVSELVFEGGGEALEAWFLVD